MLQSLNVYAAVEDYSVVRDLQMSFPLNNAYTWKDLFDDIKQYLPIFAYDEKVLVLECWAMPAELDPVFVVTTLGAYETCHSIGLPIAQAIRSQYISNPIKFWFKPFLNNIFFYLSRTDQGFFSVRQYKDLAFTTPLCDQFKGVTNVHDLECLAAFYCQRMVKDHSFNKKLPKATWTIQRIMHDGTWSLPPKALDRIPSALMYTSSFTTQMVCLRGSDDFRLKIRLFVLLNQVSHPRSPTVCWDDRTTLRSLLQSLLPDGETPLFGVDDLRVWVVPGRMIDGAETDDSIVCGRRKPPEI
jgi:hypothetical protein